VEHLKHRSKVARVIARRCYQRRPLLGMSAPVAENVRADLESRVTPVETRPGALYLSSGNPVDKDGPRAGSPESVVELEGGEGRSPLRAGRT